MKNRRAVVVALAAQTLVALAAPARGQISAKVPRVGILWFVRPSDPFVLRHMAIFRERLRELGRVEGTHIQLEPRYAEGDMQRLDETAREMVRSKVDVIVAPTLIAAVAARRATDTIPIVMVQAGSAVEAGLIASLAQPGGNVTGSTNQGFGDKQVELMREVFPRATRLALLANLSNPSHPLNVSTATDAARQSGISIVVAAVTRLAEFSQAFATIRAARPDGLLVFTDPLVGEHRSQVLELAADMGLPVCSDSARDPQAGHLMSVGSLASEHYLMAAVYVDKILKGAKPASLPVEQPTRFEVVVNLKRAKALGIAVPQAVLLRATEVIQ